MPLRRCLRHSRPIFLGSFLTSVFLTLLTLDSSAEVKLPKLISDHMIVQQGQQVRIWGTADPGEKITMTFRGQQAAVTTPTNRQWRIQLDSQSAGGPFAMKISGQNEIILNDIYVGEVWVASGQSNMVWPVAKSANPDEEIPRANYPRVRFFRVKSESLVPEQPLPDADGEWESCTPATVKEFSAAAYYFAREIHTQKHVPLGVIQSARSGTAIEAWMSQRALQAKIFLPILENWKQVQQQYPG